ncbi:MAG: hypothetical protein LBU73_07320 [Helicobacteraceae bacterium]|nr:hypothetical protein [Helicobacteraceae bacterium]
MAFNDDWEDDNLGDDLLNDAEGNESSEDDDLDYRRGDGFSRYDEDDYDYEDDSDSANDYDDE